MARYLASFPEDAGVPEIAQALISKGTVAINTLVPHKGDGLVLAKRLLPTPKRTSPGDLR